MKYPDKKQIKRKTEDFVRQVRLYIRGITKPYNVKNELNCLFIDLVLEVSKKDESKVIKGNFDNFLKEVVASR